MRSADTTSSCIAPTELDEIPELPCSPCSAALKARSLALLQDREQNFFPRRPVNAFPHPAQFTAVIVMGRYRARARALIFSRFSRSHSLFRARCFPGEAQYLARSRARFFSGEAQYLARSHARRFSGSLWGTSSPDRVHTLLVRLSAFGGWVRRSRAVRRATAPRETTATSQRRPRRHEAARTARTTRRAGRAWRGPAPPADASAARACSFVPRSLAFHHLPVALLGPAVFLSSPLGARFGPALGSHVVPQARANEDPLESFQQRAGGLGGVGRGDGHALLATTAGRFHPRRRCAAASSVSTSRSSRCTGIPGGGRCGVTGAPCPDQRPGRGP